MADAVDDDGALAFRFGKLGAVLQVAEFTFFGEQALVNGVGLLRQKFLCARGAIQAM